MMPVHNLQQKMQERECRTPNASSLPGIVCYNHLSGLQVKATSSLANHPTCVQATIPFESIHFDLPKLGMPAAPDRYKQTLRKSATLKRAQSVT